MKCINSKKIVSIIVILSIILTTTACSEKKFSKHYDFSNKNATYSLIDTPSQHETAEPFALNLCVTDSNINAEQVDTSKAVSAGLFSVNNHEVVYSNNVHEKLYPASLTKVLTAICALKYGKLTDTVEVSENALIKEPGAQLCGFKPGDKLTLEQVMYGMLIYSGNDAAVIIAEHISGSVEEFAKLMNQEAKSLGATESNFVNPNGLSNENHYTTAYDLYLIFNEAMKQDEFVKIINTKSYSTAYQTSDGTEKKITFQSTNHYLNGDTTAPEGVFVVGGKTGTTEAAGSCLILLSKNAKGENYISVILHSENKTTLYTEMTGLLGLVNHE